MCFETLFCWHLRHFLHHNLILWSAFVYVNLARIILFVTFQSRWYKSWSWLKIGKRQSGGKICRGTTDLSQRSFLLPIVTSCTPFKFSFIIWVRKFSVCVFAISGKSKTSTWTPDKFWDCSLVPVEGKGKQSATIFSYPDKWWISSKYSAMKESCLACRGLWLLDALTRQKMHAKVLWSVKTTVFFLLWANET